MDDCLLAGVSFFVFHYPSVAPKKLHVEPL